MKTVKNIFLFLLILSGVHFNLSAQNISRNRAETIAKQFITAEKGETYSVVKQQVLFNQNDAPESVYLFLLKPQGFVVVSSVNEQSPVLAYSFESNFALDDSLQKEIGFSLLKEIAYNDLNRIGENTIGHNSRQTAVIYGPYVHTMWGQVNCHDAEGRLINVTNLFTPNHYAAGCVAVSQATILHHYTWPPKGVGTYTYTDNSGSSRGTYTVDFDSAQYAWPLALERYRAKYSTTEQREAAGEIVYHCAVSLRMDFESNGSTSNVNRIPGALAQHFRFTALYRSRSSSTFWSLLDSNMVYKKPVVLAVENNSGGGHSVVCDGLKIDDDGTFYHLNMGWWGASNGWYKIRGSFNAGGYTSIVGGAMNIIPEPMIEEPEIWSDSIEFDLKWSYPGKAEAQAFQVQKSVNSGSWVTISDASTDTSIHLVVDPEKEYKFRVRAKTNGKWYQNSWSTEVPLKRKYVGIADNPLRQLKVFPNPFSNELTLSFNADDQKDMRITVCDLTGKQIENRVITSEKQIRFNTDNWKKGLYFVRVTDNNHSFTVKIIKN